MQLSSSLKVLSVGLIFLLIVTLSALYAVERKGRLLAELERDNVTKQRDSLLLTIVEQKERIESFNTLGAKNSEQLTAAKKEIDRLNDRLRSSTDRLLVKAECPVSMSSSTSSGGVEHESPARLSSSAREDYIHLRQMMAEVNQQVIYLQDYIKTQCLR